MGGFGAVAGPIAAHVGGHPAVAEEDLDAGGREPDLDGLADKPVGHRVVVAVGADFHVVIDGQLGLAPGGELITGRRKGPQGGAVEGLEEGLA